MSDRRCVACGGRALALISAPGWRGMVSDGMITGVPVERRSCRRCGTASLSDAACARLPRRLFTGRYALNAATPGIAEAARHQAYASRVARLCGMAAPASILDVGCGNGGLLLAFRRYWSGARLQGVEPAPGPARIAVGADLPVAPILRPGMRAALVTSVNVIEHTPDPVNFLRGLRDAVAPGGAAVVICPDGSRPWSELLMSDHRWSLTPVGLQALVGLAGFAVIQAEPGDQGGFQAIALRPVLRRMTATRFTASVCSRGGLVIERRRYLAAWRGLDASLLARANGRRIICFGTGEAAQLIRAYAPQMWRAVRAVTSDPPVSGAGLGKPVVDLADISRTTDCILLAVAPQAQASLGARMTANGLSVVRWDDIVPR